MELNSITIFWFTVAIITALHTLWTVVTAVVKDRLPPFLARDPKQAAPFVWGGVLLGALCHAIYLLVML